MTPVDLVAAATPQPNESFAQASEAFRARLRRSEWRPLTSLGASLYAAVEETRYASAIR